MKELFCRQGEVFLLKIDKLPDNLTLKDNILARGEATGHTHRIVGNAKTFTDNKQQYLQVMAECELQHEEHQTITVPQGIYKVSIQREYDVLRDVLRDEARQVTD